MSEPIVSVTLVTSTNHDRNPRGEELSDAKVRGVKAVVNVLVKRTKGKPEKQELRGTYKITPNPHDNPVYNNKNQPRFYNEAAQAAAQHVTTGPAYALVPVTAFTFTFGDVTYRATPWDGPISRSYKNRWRVDGPQEPPP